MLVKKANGKWQMYVNFTNLNQVCLKDCCPLPRIDQLLDVTAEFQYLSSLDAYSVYHQIPMNSKDEEQTAFVTNIGTFCCKVMPFGLKNVGAIYQRMVMRVFKGLIGRNMEAYIDDM